MRGSSRYKQVRQKTMGFFERLKTAASSGWGASTFSALGVYGASVITAADVRTPPTLRRQLMRRLNCSCRRSMALIVLTLFNWLGEKPREPGCRGWADSVSAFSRQCKAKLARLLWSELSNVCSRTAFVSIPVLLMIHTDVYVFRLFATEEFFGRKRRCLSIALKVAKHSRLHIGRPLESTR